MRRRLNELLNVSLEELPEPKNEKVENTIMPIDKTEEA
jgi:hypothetical protein